MSDNIFKLFDTRVLFIDYFLDVKQREVNKKYKSSIFNVIE